MSFHQVLVRKAGDQVTAVAREVACACTACLSGLYTDCISMDKEVQVPQPTWINIVPAAPVVPVVTRGQAAVMRVVGAQELQAGELYPVLMALDDLAVYPNASFRVIRLQDVDGPVVSGVLFEHPLKRGRRPVGLMGSNYAYDQIYEGVEEVQLPRYRVVPLQIVQLSLADRDQHNMAAGKVDHLMFVRLCCQRKHISTNNPTHMCSKACFCTVDWYAHTFTSVLQHA